MNIPMMPGERLIWKGKPAQGFRFTPQDIFAIPFALFWLFMVLATLVFLPGEEAPGTGPIVYAILPLFVLIGLYMLIGRFLIDRMMRRRTSYFLTNQRAVIESGLFGSTRRSVNLAAVAEVRFRQGRRGKGTLQFGGSGPFGMMPTGWPGASQFLPPAFDGIEDAARVYDLVISAQRDARMPA